MSVKPNPNPVDIAVGAAIRARRKLLGVSQSTLGDALGVSFQQVQKYERGDNRISASMMDAAAKALKCHPGDFFPDARPVADIHDDMIMPSGALTNGTPFLGGEAHV